MMSDTAATIGMTAPHPGAFIRDEILDELGLSISEAAALGVRRATLSDLVNGHTALSPEMALRIEKAFGINMEMLPAPRRRTPSARQQIRLALGPALDRASEL